MKKLKKMLLMLLTIAVVFTSFTGLAMAGESGVAATEGQTISSEGSLKKENGKWYYYDSNGKLVRKPGWYKIGNGAGLGISAWHYIGEDGAAYEGWHKISNKWYYFLCSPYTGNMVEDDSIVYKGASYAFDKKGAMITGWSRITDEDLEITIWVYADKSGKLAKNGWHNINGKWYFFGQSDDYSGPVLREKWSGINMRTGWIKTRGKWYHLAKSGVMQTGWVKIAKKWYYLNNSGVRQTGWQKIDGNWYYFRSNGVMVTGKQKIKGKIYTFSPKGIWLK